MIVVSCAIKLFDKHMNLSSLKSHYRRLFHGRYGLHTAIGLALVSLGLLSVVILVSQSQELRRSAAGLNGPVVLTFLPASNSTLTPGSQAEIKVIANTGNNSVRGIQFSFNVEGNIPSDLAFVNSQPEGLALLGNQVGSVGSNHNLFVSFIANILSGELSYTSSNQSVELGAIKFTVPSTGSITFTTVEAETKSESVEDASNLIGIPSSLSYQFAQPTPTMTSSPAPSPSTSPTPSPTPATGQNVSGFNLKVTFPGVTSNRGPINANVSVGQLGSSSTLSSSNVTFSYQNGAYQSNVALTSPVPSNSNYWVAVKGEKHTQRVFTDVTLIQNTLLDLTSKPIEPGDLPPQDGVVNSSDISKLSTIFAKPQPSAAEIQTADLNYDGQINSIDFGLILSTLSNKPDEIIF